MTVAKTVAVELVKITKEHGTTAEAKSIAAKASNDTLIALVENGIISEEFFGEVVGELAVMALMKMLGVEPDLS